MRLRALGSFLLQDMFLNLQAFAFEGQSMKFTVNMLLTCILYCYAGPGCLIRSVCKYSMWTPLTDIVFFRSSYVFLGRRRSLTSGKLYVCLPRSYMFLASIWSSSCRSMFWLFFIFFVLDSNVAVFAYSFVDWSD